MILPSASHPRHRVRRCLPLLLAIVGSPVFGAALDPSEVIAESARARLTIGDYQAEVAKLPATLRAEFAANPLRLRQYLDNLYMLRVLAADARAQGLEKDPVLARQIALQVDRMLAQARVDRIEAAAAADFDRNGESYVARARELYLVNRDQYAIPERVRAAHILIKVVDGNRDAALRKAETIRAQALAPGADFAKLAREFSDDPKAATNGGELGYFAASAMDPAFAAAAFALQKPGDISAPVLSKFGYHIIRLEDRRPATIRTFDEMKSELLAQLRKKAVDDARAAAQRQIFSDPTLKVNAALIEQINSEAAAASASETAAHAQSSAGAPK
jgi:peptidyl-prolyl cis-trans isomerase C